VRKIHFIWLVLALCALFSGIVRAETFELADGETVSGEIVSFNESGLILRTPDDKYSDRIPWSRFSQRDLRQLAENQKIQPLVEPFIEETPEERLARSEIKLSPVPRLERPKDMSLFLKHRTVHARAAVWSEHLCRL
jgi:hypothetical protein